MDKIKIESNFATTDFHGEIVKILVDNGFIEYEPTQKTSKGIKIGGWRTKRKYNIFIVGE